MSVFGRSWRKEIMFIGLLVITLVFRPATQTLEAFQTETSPLASELDATPMVDWVKVLYERIMAEKINPPAAARLYAYAGITLYEAVLPGIPGNLSLSGQATDMPEMPAIEADVVYDWSASVTGAMSVLVPAILPENADTTQAVDLLRQQQVNARNRDIDAEVVERSLAYGESVGNAILAWSQTDYAKEAHAEAADFVLETDETSAYVLTTEGTKPVEPYWGKVRPFGIVASNVCDQALDLEFSTDPSSSFYAQALEVKTTGENLTPAQEDIINFWVDTPGITGTPAGHWMQIMGQLVPQLGLNMDRAGEGFAMVGIAVGDAFISGWNTKYIVMLLRPETYIHQYIDPNWQPYVQTPPFPEFVSGHSIVSQTAASVLTSVFGTVAFQDDSERFRNLPRRSFTSFQAAASEAGISRLYGGIHYRTGIEKGLDQGRCVAANILERIHLHPDN